MEQSALIRLATWLAPLPALLLLAFGLSWDDTDAREAWNAGQVLGGRIHRGGTGAVMDQLVQEPHRVWVLGNSNANTDIDRADLAAGLGLPARQIVVLSVPNANTAHWLAMLRRLRDAPHRPDTVLVVSRLQLVLVDTPISETARRSLDALLRPGDADLAALAHPTGEHVARVLRRREAVRDRIGRELRVGLPYTLGLPRPETMLRRALSDDRIDVDRLGPPPPRPLPAPEDSLVEELASLCASLGVRLVVIRPPASPIASSQQADRVPEGYPDRTRALFEKHGATYVDLTDLRMQRHHYKNVDHLDEEGARRLTGAILTVLDPHPGLDALGRASFDRGRYVVRRGQLAYAATDVPELEAQPPAVDGARDGVKWLEAPMGVPTDSWTMAVTQLRARCSPVRVITDAGTLSAGAPCRRLRPGQTCHGPDRVGFIAPDATEWRLAIAPERTCEGAAWLYPDDELRLRWPLEPDPAGATHVLLAASAFRPRTRITYAVRRQGDVVARGRLDNHGAVTEVPIEPGPPPTVVFRSTHYALVTRAELVRR